MSRALSASIAASGAILWAVLSVASLSLQAAELSYSIAYPNGEAANVRLRTGARNESVTLTYSRIVRDQTKKIEKTFGAEILEELRGAWGPRPFEIDQWHSDFDCYLQITWTVRSGGNTRTVCHDLKTVSRLNDFESAVEAALKF